MVLDSRPWSYIAVTSGWLKFWGGFIFLVFTQKLRNISNDQFWTCLCFSRSVVQPSTRQRFAIEILPLMPGLVVATATTQLESLEDLGSWHVDTSGELLGIPGKDFSCQEKTHTLLQSPFGLCFKRLMCNMIFHVPHWNLFAITTWWPSPVSFWLLWLFLLFLMFAPDVHLDYWCFKHQPERYDSCFLGIAASAAWWQNDEKDEGIA